jgi:hypothetical protein
LKKPWFPATKKLRTECPGAIKKIENKFVEAFLTPDDDAQDKTDSGVNNQNDEKEV